jgi:hypothetical protein
MERDDRLLKLTIFTFAPLALLSAIFGPLLFLFPTRTDQTFSWTITPPMSAVFIGAGYISGAIAIIYLLRQGRWHPMRPFSLGGWGFILAAFGATLLHWDRFHHGTFFFYIWFLVYAIGPFLIPIAFWYNEKRNRPHDSSDRLLPRPLRLGLIIGGILFTIIGIILFINPALFIPYWPWELTPLIGRIIAGWIFLPSLGAAAAFFEPRYTAYRPLLQLSTIWAILVLVGSLLHLSEFDFGRPVTWLWFAYLIMIIPVMIIIYRYYERPFAATPATAMRN